MHTCRHAFVGAMVASEWWALRATGQGPHEKLLCLGGTKRSPGSPSQRRMVTSSHTHHTNIAHSRGGAGHRLNQLRMRGWWDTHVLIVTEEHIEHAHRAALWNYLFDLTAPVHLMHLHSCSAHTHEKHLAGPNLWFLSDYGPVDKHVTHRSPWMGLKGQW